MYNDYYLLKRIEHEEGAVSFATVQDSSTYMGEVVDIPTEHVNIPQYPQVGDKVIFLKGSGEDIGDGLKAIKLEDIIKKI